MANAVATQVDDPTKEYLPTIGEFRELVDEIKKTGVNLNPLTSQFIAEQDTKAKEFLAEYEKSIPHQRVGEAFRVHKFLKQAENKITEYPLLVRQLCSSWLSQRETLRRRKLEAEQREREIAAKAQQEADRAAEVEHLKSLGKAEEAEQRAADPILPVSLPDNKDALKVEDISMATKRRGTVENLLELAAWVVANPSWAHLIEPAESQINKALTANPTLILPGVKAEEYFEKRNRG